MLAAGVALTGGLLYPYAHAYFMRYKLNALSFGGQQVTSDFSSRTIYGTFILCGIVSIVLAIAVVAMWTVSLGVFSALHVSGAVGMTPTESGIGSFSVLFVLIIFLPLAWYWTKFFREAARSVRIGTQEIRVTFEATGWRLVRYIAGNWAIMIFSLGLLWPLTWTRKIDLICDCLTINGELPLEEMMQEAHDPTQVGEELAGGFEIV